MFPGIFGKFCALLLHLLYILNNIHRIACEFPDKWCGRRVANKKRQWHLTEIVRGGINFA